MLRVLRPIVAFAFVASFAITVNADLLTSDTISPSVVIDFSTQPTVTSVTGPLQIGDLVGMDVTVTTMDGTPNLTTNYDGWGLCANGDWGSPRTYISSQSQAGMRIAFNDGPVAQVGGLMNNARDCGPDLVITALDSNMNVLETYNVTQLANILTNEGAFRGISRVSADITYLEINGESPVLDDLTFSSDADIGPPGDTVPVPMSVSSLILLAGILSLFGLITIRRRRSIR